MNKFKSSLILSIVIFSACTTPYNPPVLVNGGMPFQGLVGLIEKSSTNPVDVLLVHGMCSHNSDWAHQTIDRLTRAINKNFVPVAAPKMDASPAVGGIETIERTENVAGGVVHFSAIVWSPLTRSLKAQLSYDQTGKPSNCSSAEECVPKRASLNGQLKDSLLNDCLADAMIYQGKSREAIRRQLVDVISSINERSHARARDLGVTPGPLVIVSESLGSKLTFDALEEMLNGSGAGERSKAAGKDMLNRLSLVFMGANQLPILGLADQTISSEPRTVDGSPEFPPDDSVHRVLRLKSVNKSNPSNGSPAIPALLLVAFSDPNDLLSYQLQPSKYSIPGVGIADVLVSNATTYFGALERPDKAHTEYRTNDSVATLISCGIPKSAKCK